MLKENKTKEENQEVMEMLVERIKNLGFENIKADIPECDSPGKLINQNTNDVFIPDATANSRNGKKVYFELSRKVKNTKGLINKWKLLATMATIRQGLFQIFVPHGTMKFTKELIMQHQINAELIKM